MVDREELLLIVRALLRRPVETLLLTVGVALTVGATVTAVTLAPRVAADSERLLSSLRYREIVVTTTVDHAAMDAPARELLPGVEFTIDDLDRVRSATQAVQYAYAAVETVMRLHGAGGPRPRHETVRGMKVTRDFFPAGKLRAAAGSLFTAEELALGEPIMVIGSELGATLFDDGRTLGRTVAADLRESLRGSSSSHPIPAYLHGTSSNGHFDRCLKRLQRSTKAWHLVLGHESLTCGHVSR